MRCEGIRLHTLYRNERLPGLATSAAWPISVQSARLEFAAFVRRLDLPPDFTKGMGNGDEDEDGTTRTGTRDRARMDTG